MTGGRQGVGETSVSRGGGLLTLAEHTRIDKVKEAHPEYHHRRIQGV